jgi:hypothetical protein
MLMLRRFHLPYIYGPYPRFIDKRVRRRNFKKPKYYPVFREGTFYA